MGCDFSFQVKEIFHKKIEVIYSDMQQIKEVEGKVNEYKKEFIEITDFPNDLRLIRNDLEKSLIKLENILEDVKNQLKDRSETIELEKKIIVQPITDEKQISFQDTKKIANKSKSKKRLTNNPQSESILQDPEIFALIEKNRKLLMRQLTK